jgi:hypothetical protein
MTDDPETIALRVTVRGTRQAQMICGRSSRAGDPATGAQKWRYDPKVSPSQPPGNRYVCRGVTYWVDEQAPEGAACSSRIFMGTNDYRVIRSTSGPVLPAPILVPSMCCPGKRKDVCGVCLQCAVIQVRADRPRRAFRGTSFRTRREDRSSIVVSSSHGAAGLGRQSLRRSCHCGPQLWRKSPQRRKIRREIYQPNGPHHHSQATAFSLDGRNRPPCRCRVA